MKITLACLEEDLYGPSFSILSNDLFFRKAHVSANYSKPVLPVGSIPYINNLCLYGVKTTYLIFFSKHHIYRKKIFGAAATFSVA